MIFQCIRRGISANRSRNCRTNALFRQKQAGLHRSFGNREYLRDFRDRQVFPKAENNDLAQFQRQQFQRGTHNSRLLPNGKGVQRVWTRIDLIWNLVRKTQGIRSLPALVRANLVDKNRIKPVKDRSLCAERVTLQNGSFQSAKGIVLGIRLTPAQANRRLIEPRAVHLRQMPRIRLPVSLLMSKPCH